MLEPLPEADAIVSTSFFKNVTLQVADPGPVSRVIGLDRKVIHRGSGVGLHGGADSALPTAGTLPPPWRYDDHTGSVIRAVSNDKSCERHGRVPIVLPRWSRSANCCRD